MREFALVKDAFRDELFAIVTRDNGLTTCHGIHDAGREWAHDYNQGQTKSLKSSLDPGVSIGPFAPITPGMQALIDESLEGKSVRFPDLNSLCFVESVDFRHRQSIPQVKDARLRNITLSGLHRGADYKGMAFLLDKGRSSALLKARLGSMGFDKDGIGFKSRHIEKGILNEEMSDTAIGYGNARRAVKDVIIRKDLLTQEHGGYIVKDKPEPIDVIRTKANRLGRRLAPGGRGGGIGGGIRKIGRSMKDPFDPNAWDGDRDGIVQEGTIWERPSVPGININLPGTRSTRSKPDNFPADDPRRVGRDIERRQNQDQIVSDLLSGSVRDALNDDRISEEAIAPLKELLKYHHDEDEIWDTPLADIGGMEGGEEETLDDFLEYAVEDIEEHLHERNRQSLRDVGFGRSTRSQRDDAPSTTEAQRREDGSYGPPPGYETWADFEADWPDDDDDIDADTERVVDERDEYPDDWGGQLGATEGGTRSQRLRQGDKVTVRHDGKDVEGTVVRFGRGGQSGVGVDSYVIDVGELRSIWKRPDEILKGPDSRGGFRSRKRRIRPTSHGRGRPNRKPRRDSRSDRVRRGRQEDEDRRRTDREGRDWGWGDPDDDERDSTRSQRGRDAREQMRAIAELGDNPLDELIARDRDGGMTLEEAAKKYGLTREVIRAREIQHRRRVADGGTRSQRGARSPIPYQDGLPWRDPDPAKRELPTHDEWGDEINYENMTALGFREFNDRWFADDDGVRTGGRGRYNAAGREVGGAGEEGGTRSRKIESSTGENGPKVPSNESWDWGSGHNLTPEADKRPVNQNADGHWVQTPESGNALIFKPYDKETKKEFDALQKRLNWLRRYEGDSEDIDRELNEIRDRIMEIGSKKLLRADAPERGGMRSQRGMRKLPAPAYKPRKKNRKTGEWEGGWQDLPEHPTPPKNLGPFDNVEDEERFKDEFTEYYYDLIDYQDDLMDAMNTTSKVQDGLEGELERAGLDARGAFAWSNIVSKIETDGAAALAEYYFDGMPDGRRLDGKDQEALTDLFERIAMYQEDMKSSIKDPGIYLGLDHQHSNVDTHMQNLRNPRTRMQALRNEDIANNGGMESLTQEPWMGGDITGHGTSVGVGRQDIDPDLMTMEPFSWTDENFRNMRTGGLRSQRDPGLSRIGEDKYYDLRITGNWSLEGETGRGRSHSAHLTSDELIELNDVLNQAREAFDRAVFGSDGGDEDLHRIMRLQESIGTALLAQDVIVLGNKKEIDDTIESLLRVYDGVGEPWPGMSDVIGTLESARDSDKGEWVSPNLIERGHMLSDPGPGTIRRRRRVPRRDSSRRGGTRSRREPQDHLGRDMPFEAGLANDELDEFDTALMEVQGHLKHRSDDIRGMPGGDPDFDDPQENEDYDRITKLIAAVNDSRPSKSPVELGNSKDLDDMIDLLRRASTEDRGLEVDHAIGILEQARDNEFGYYESPNLGGTRSRMGDIGRAADAHRRSGAAGRAYRDSFRDDSGDERFLENDVIGDIRNRSLNDLYENDLISPEVDRYINEKLVPEGLGEGDPEWDYIMNEKIDELTMTRLGEKILETIEEDFREGNQDWYRNRFGDGGGGPDPYDERVDEGQFRDGGTRSFREFDRRVRENAPYDSPEGRRHRREDSQEYGRMLDALMSTDGSMPKRWSGMTREEAVEELSRLGNNARVTGTGPGTYFGELRSLVAKKHRSRFGAGGAGYGTRSRRVPAGRRGRGGVRARQREAATDRAAMPRGTGTRSRRHTRVHQQPGVDRFKDADGDLWTNLGTEENAQDIREAIAEAAHFQLNRLMWGLAHNDLDRHATPQKSGSIHRAEGDPTPATGRVADRAHALEIGRIGYNESNGVAKDYFDKEVRDAPHNADKDDEWFRNYVFDDSDIADIESWVEKSIYTTAEGTQQKIKAQLQDIKTLRNMIKQYNETGGPGGGGDLDSFAFLEHLNPASRRKIFERASGPKRDRIPGSSGVNKDGVAIGGAPAAWRGATTLHAPKDVREARTSKLGGGRRRSMHEWRKEMATRIMAPNEARRRRIAAARARAGGAFALPGRRVDPLKPTMQERIETAKRKARRLFRGNPGFAKRDKQIRDNRKHEPLLRSTDRLVQGAGAKLDFPEYEEADRGLPVVTDRFRKNLAALAAQRRRLQAGEEKKKKSGDQEKGETVFAGEPDSDQLLVDAMYLNFGFTERPVVVNEQGLADALLNPDALVILRGMGKGAPGRKFARAYLDFRGRFIGGKAGQGHGRGDDWARPLDPASGTPGTLYGGYGEGVLAVIDPRHFRIADQAKMVDIQDEHRAIDGAIGKVVSESAEGSSITDVVRKSPPDEIAAQIRRQLDADQADGKLRLPNRTGQRERVWEQGGKNTYDGYRITSGDSAMEAPWAETETGSIIDQLLTQLADNPTPEIQEEVAEALEMMHILQGLDQNDTFMYLPILGIDGIHRNGGVVKVANRGALTAYHEPMGKTTVKALLDKIAPGHLIEQVRREQRG